MDYTLLLQPVVYISILIITTLSLIFTNFKTLSFWATNVHKTLFVRADKLDIETGQYNFKEQKLRNLVITCSKIKGIDNNIFQIFLNQKEIPIEILENITKLKLLNPGWKYFLITDENVHDNINNFADKQFSKVYNSVNDNYPAVKSDLLRYMLLYNYGGLYLDIKSSIEKPIKDIIVEDKINIYKLCILEYPTGLCLWRSKMKETEIVQFILLYPKNHHFLVKLMKNIYIKYAEYKKDITLKQSVFEFTGPTIYTNTISEIKTDDNSVVLSNFKDSGIIYNNLKYSHHDYYKTVHYSDVSSNILK